MKKYILIFCALLNYGCAPQDDRISDQTTLEVVGIIRVDPKTKQWVILQDQYHTSKNIKAIVTYPDYAEMFFDFNASKIETFIISPDETFASLGISAGASVGTYNALIYYGRLGHSISTADLAIPGSNFFVYGVFKK